MHGRRDSYASGERQATRAVTQLSERGTVIRGVRQLRELWESCMSNGMTGHGWGNCMTGGRLYEQHLVLAFAMTWMADRSHSPSIPRAICIVLAS